MANQYTDQTAIENYLLIDIDTSFDTQVTEWIEQITKYIELYTGRVFIADTEATTKIYQIVLNETDDIGKYTGSVVDLQIDDAVDVTALVIDDDTIDTDDYLLYPANAECKTRIKLTDASGLVFTKGEQNIDVTAKWGYSVSCPSDIAFACLVLTAGVVSSSMSSEGDVKSVAMGAYNLTFKDSKAVDDYQRAIRILDSYKRIGI